ncbi:hypothetical protein C8K30_101993 [Promicromonospora sp. AC04]|nr:hypothetical protein C8K30_101993 [Promicromonospora sp. AC04]
MGLTWWFSVRRGALGGIGPACCSPLVGNVLETDSICRAQTWACRKESVLPSISTPPAITADHMILAKVIASTAAPIPLHAKRGSSA